MSGSSQHGPRGPGGHRVPSVCHSPTRLIRRLGQTSSGASSLRRPSPTFNFHDFLVQFLDKCICIYIRKQIVNTERISWRLFSQTRSLAGFVESDLKGCWMFRAKKSGSKLPCLGRHVTGARGRCACM